MGSIRICHLEDHHEFGRLLNDFETMHPALRLRRSDVDGECVLRARHGGMRVFWIYSGEGEVLLEEGFRTKEGDGQALPHSYRSDPIDPELAARLDALEGSTLDPIQAIRARRRGNSYVGDCAGDLWKLVQLPEPWSDDPQAIDAIRYLMEHYRDCGCSTKVETSWEAVMAGDQLTVAGDERLRVRGRFSCLTMEKVDRPVRHVPSAMRLRYLRDSAGGCNFSFDPFRRLPLTWHVNLPGEEGDGVNFVNSHVVNIAQETSPTHFHPPAGVDGGAPQNEMYLVLDPKEYRLNTYGRHAQLVAYPDLHDLRRFEVHDLQPGNFVYIPAGTGHRGLDAFVNVLTVPGFRPNNEFYIDEEIRDRAGDAAPYNASLTGIRNYEDIEHLLEGEQARR